MHENGQWPPTRLTTSTAVAATATSNGATNDKPKMGNCEHKVTNYNELKRWMLRFICFFFLSWNLPGAKSMYFVRPFSSNFCIHLKPGNGGEKKMRISIFAHNWYNYIVNYVNGMHSFAWTVYPIEFIILQLVVGIALNNRNVSFISHYWNGTKKKCAFQRYCVQTERPFFGPCILHNANHSFFIFGLFLAFLSAAIQWQIVKIKNYT